MRDHIKTTVLGASQDLNRLVAALDGNDSDEIVAALLDATDRLFEERLWLVRQPVSSLLDPQAKVIVNRYRSIVIKALLEAERYLLTADPEDIPPWLDTMTEMAGVLSHLDAIPED